jgi:hypothetical protein
MVNPSKHRRKKIDVGTIHKSKNKMMGLIELKLFSVTTIKIFDPQCALVASINRRFRHA